MDEELELLAYHEEDHRKLSIETLLIRPSQVGAIHELPLLGWRADKSIQSFTDQKIFPK